MITLILFLVVLWAIGFFVFPIVGGLIHILLVVALIALVLHLARRTPAL